MQRNIRIVTLAALPLLSCGPADRAPGAVAEAAPARPQYVDSARTIEEELRRFRADLPHAPEGLENGARSREELVRRFVAALEASDTAALAALHMTRGEFAYLYYPSTRYTRPPHELAPGLLWFLIQQNGGKGLQRLLHRYGGRPFGYTGHRCEPEPQQEGANRLWHECRLRRNGAAGDVPEPRLFGSIIERDGRYKFVSYANGL